MERGGGSVAGLERRSQRSWLREEWSRALRIVYGQFV
jgi:hypothetical protein